MTKTDLLRELEKIYDALQAADVHFQAEAKMNAALHMSDVVRPAPLASAIGVAYLASSRLVNQIATEGVTE